MIRNATESDIPRLAAIIRNSHRDVAERFGLTPENCPTHPSNCAPEWIEAAFAKGVTYYTLEAGCVPCGCVALERAGDGVCYLERLAVLPEFRDKGFGKALVNHIFDEAKRLGASHVGIGIIAGHVELQAWYERLGFLKKNTARFKHLPFDVTFMGKSLRKLRLRRLFP